MIVLRRPGNQSIGGFRESRPRVDRSGKHLFTTRRDPAMISVMDRDNLDLLT